MLSHRQHRSSLFWVMLMAPFVEGAGFAPRYPKLSVKAVREDFEAGFHVRQVIYWCWLLVVMGCCNCAFLAIRSPDHAPRSMSDPLREVIAITCSSYIVRTYT